MVTDWLVATVEVEAVKVAEEDPAATVTDEGSLTALLLSDSATTPPPAGAGPDSVTVQLLDAPPCTVAGEHCTWEIVTAETVRENVWEAPL
jgi:hypothetical protein